MSKSVERAPTPADFIVRNMARKGSNPSRKSPRRADPSDLWRKLTMKLTDARKNSTFRVRSPSVFSILRHGESGPFRWGSPTNTTVFTRLGEIEKNVFTRLGKREKDVFLRLGTETHPVVGTRVPEDMQRKIEREWDVVDRANRGRPTQAEEEYIFESDNDGGGHWKSKSKKPKSTTDEEDLS
ncbi:hypothetical protein Tco_1427468 [Tanacetum coccineum]